MKLILLTLVCLSVGELFAAEPTPEQAARFAAAQKRAGEINYRGGETVIGDKLAKISVPPPFRFVDAKDTTAILSEIWGNPRGSAVLGSIVPLGFDPLAADGWIVVITYDEDGFVKDDDAAKIDYTKMLVEMREGTKAANAEREKQGYGAVDLIGWAKPPRYDQSTHKLYWAKELKFAGSTENTLNYNIRMLGRHGVLVLNAVAAMHELPQVEAATPAILGMVNFQEGKRYTDFNSSTDKTATYGLAALVAGGVAVKAGLFKGLWLGILALKKFIIIALVVLGGWLKKIFSRVRGTKVVTSASSPKPPTDV